MARLPRPVIWTALLLGVVLVFVFAARYTRSTSDRLRSTRADRLTITFLPQAIPVPDIAMRTLTGESITTSSLAGKVVVVNFWATWCHPCREEIPDLIKLQTAYRDQLAIIGVSAEIPGVDLSNDTRSAELARAFAAEWNLNYPVVMQTDRILDAFTGIFALPTSFVIDPKGRIVQKHVGLVSPVVLEQEIRALLELPTEARIEGLSR